MFQCSVLYKKKKKVYTRIRDDGLYCGLKEKKKTRIGAFRAHAKINTFLSGLCFIVL